MKKFSDIYEKKVDVVKRKKQARRMARLVQTKQFQIKKTRSLLKRRDTAKLTVVAKKKVTNKYRKKLAPDYKDMSPQQKIVIDQRVQQKYGVKIAKITKKIIPKLKAAEGERIQKAKAAYQAGRETE